MPPNDGPNAPQCPVPRSNPWRTLRSDIATVRQLLANRDDNPVLVHNRPTRFPWRRVFFLVFEILIVVGLFASAPTLIYQYHANYSESLHWIPFIGLLTIMPWLAFLGFLVYGYRRVEPSHLEEFALTTTTPGEAAFGALWWPWVGAFFHLALPLLALATFEALTFRSHGEPFFALSRILTVFAAWALAMSILTRIWLRFGRGFVRPLIQGVVFYLRKLAIALSVILFCSHLLFRVVFDFEEGDFFHAVLPAMAFVALVWRIARRNLRTAGPSLFAPVNPEAMAYEDWAFNEALAQKENDRFLANWRKAFSVARPGKREGLCVWGVVAALFAAAGILGMVQTRNSPVAWSVGLGRGLFGWSSAITLPLYMTTLSILFRCRGRGSTRLPLVAGSIMRSVVPPLAKGMVFTVAIAASHALFMAVGGRGRFQDVEWLETLMGAGGVALGGFLLSGAAALSLLPRGRRLWIGGSWLFAALSLHFLPLLDMEKNADTHLFLYAMGNGFLSRTLFPLVIAGLGLTLLYVLPDLPKRMHERELRSIERNAVTGSAAPTVHKRD